MRKGFAGAGRLPVTLGAWACIFGTVQFFVLHLIVQSAWPEPYSWAHNNISDLGVVGCGPLDGRYACSPLHDWMNASFVLQGTLPVAGMILLRPVRRDLLTRTSLVFISLGGVGWILAGLAPADVDTELHILAAMLVFFCGNVGLIFAENPARANGSQNTRTYPRTLGTVGLVATALFLGQQYVVFGMGGMERLAVIPLQAWAVLAGTSVLRTLAKETPDQPVDGGQGSKPRGRREKPPRFQR